MKRIYSFLFTVLIGTALSIIPELALAKKGGNGGGGGDTSTGEECVNSTSDFPAIAYTTNASDGNAIYLGSSTGDCSILIYTGNGSSAGNVNYIQSGNRGRIVWSQDWDDGTKRKNRLGVIKMLEFNVGNRAVTTSLPLSATTLHTVGRSISGNSFSASEFHSAEVVLSQDGNQLAFGHRKRFSDGAYENSINIMDLTSCTSNCDYEPVLLSGTPTFNGFAWGKTGARLYYVGGIPGDLSLGGQHAISFLEKNESGVWDGPRVVATAQEPPYYFEDEERKFYSISILYWDHDHDSNGVESEMVAFQVTTLANDVGAKKAINVIDVSNCSVSRAGTCLSTEESTIEFTMDEVETPRWTGGSSATLLVRSDDYSEALLLEVNLDTGAVVEILSGVRLADPAY